MRNMRKKYGMRGTGLLSTDCLRCRIFPSPRVRTHTPTSLLLCWSRHVRQEEKRKRSAEVDRALRGTGGDETLTATIRHRAQREEAKHKVRLG